MTKFITRDETNCICGVNYLSWKEQLEFPAMFVDTNILLQWYKICGDKKTD